MLKKRILIYLIIVALLFTACIKDPISEEVNSKVNSSVPQINSSLTPSSDEIISSSSQQESSSQETQSSQEQNASTQTQSSQNQSSNTQTQSSQKQSSTQKPPPSQQATPPNNNGFTWDKGGNYNGPINIKEAISPKINVVGNANTMIDISNSKDGYITVSHKGSSKRLKFQVIKDKTYNYDLNNNGNEEIFILQMGSGNYDLRVMENIQGSSYVQIFKTTVNVAITDSFSPYLYPNQYVKYTKSNTAIKKSFDITMNGKTDLEKVSSAYNYIINNIKYDYHKAETVTAGYLPSVDETLRTNKGICFDYAVLLTAMLRAQNIPTKMVIGKVAPNSLDHAWNEVYIKGKGWIAIGIKSDGSQWKRLDPTFSSSQTQAEIAKFINNSKNYTALRIY